MPIAEPHIGNYRYIILALIFMATTINYFDRSILGVRSLFGMLHTAIRPAFSLIGFIVARFGLGIHLPGIK